jgi:isoleucyl-tRNA synthetase
MFDLNETINWKPKATGRKVGKMPMTGIYRVQDSILTPIWRTEDKQEEILIGSVEELYNEIENRLLLVSKTNPFKGFEIGIPNPIMI